MVIFDPWKSKCMKTMISDHAAAVMIIANERLAAAGPPRDVIAHTNSDK